MQQTIVPQNIKRVLIIALGSLGDVVLSIAAIEAIRNYHQDAHIVVLTEPNCARIFENCPYIDEYITNHRTIGIKEDLALKGALQKAHFDMVYDLSCNDESDELYKKFWPIRPKWSGVANNCSHPHIDRGRENLHPLDRLAEQLWLCGIGPKEGYPLGATPLPNLDYLIPTNEAHNYTPKALGIDYEYALLIPEGAKNDAQNAWPTFRYIDLCNLLLSQGMKPIVCGTHEAIVLGNEIRAGFPDILDLVGRLDLLSFISLAKNAKLVIGSNSDMAIIAAIANAPLVALVNPQSQNLKKSAPRGNKCVTLVSKDFAQIAPNQIMQAAKAVIE